MSVKEINSYKNTFEDSEDTISSDYSEQLSGEINSDSETEEENTRVFLADSEKMKLMFDDFRNPENNTDGFKALSDMSDVRTDRTIFENTILLASEEEPERQSQTNNNDNPPVKAQRRKSLTGTLKGLKNKTLKSGKTDKNNSSNISKPKKERRKSLTGTIKGLKKKTLKSSSKIEKNEIVNNKNDNSSSNSKIKRERRKSLTHTIRKATLKGSKILNTRMTKRKPQPNSPLDNAITSWIQECGYPNDLFPEPSDEVCNFCYEALEFENKPEYDEIKERILTLLSDPKYLPKENLDDSVIDLFIGQRPYCYLNEEAIDNIVKKTSPHKLQKRIKKPKKLTVNGQEINKELPPIELGTEFCKKIDDCILDGEIGEEEYKENITEYIKIDLSTHDNTALKEFQAVCPSLRLLHLAFLYEAQSPLWSLLAQDLLKPLYNPKQSRPFTLSYNKDKGHEIHFIKDDDTHAQIVHKIFMHIIHFETLKPLAQFQIDWSYPVHITNQDPNNIYSYGLETNIAVLTLSHLKTFKGTSKEHEKKIIKMFKKAVQKKGNYN